MDFLKHLFNQEPEAKPTPAPEERAPEVEEFVEIGGSPVLGIKLLAIVRGHNQQLNNVYWSHDDSYLAIPSQDHTVGIWDAAPVLYMRAADGALF